MPNNNNNKSKQTTKSTKSGKQKQGAQVQRQRQVAVAYGGELKQQAAVIRSVGGSMLVTHREYITDVLSTSNSFNANSLSINPGMATTFPWLNKIATNFEKYRLKKLIFKYESLVGSIQAGSVMMAIDMDASDSLPSGKMSMLQYQNAARSNVWGTCETRLPEQAKQLYVRGGSALGDVKSYDTGIFYYATQGTGSTSITLGEIWVEYTVELAIPTGQAS